MQRSLYLTTLLLLQIALIGWVAPPLARLLPLVTAPGLAPGGWPAMLQLVATAATIAGTSVALAFPVVALVRHRRSGPPRFLGLPEWPTVIASWGMGAPPGGVARPGQRPAALSRPARMGDRDRVVRDGRPRRRIDRARARLRAAGRGADDCG